MQTRMEPDSANFFYFLPTIAVLMLMQLCTMMTEQAEPTSRELTAPVLKSLSSRRASARR